MKKAMRRFICIFLCILCAIPMTGCGGTSRTAVVSRMLDALGETEGFTCYLNASATAEFRGERLSASAEGTGEYTGVPPSALAELTLRAGDILTRADLRIYPDDGGVVVYLTLPDISHIVTGFSWTVPVKLPQKGELGFYTAVGALLMERGELISVGEPVQLGGRRVYPVKLTVPGSLLEEYVDTGSGDLEVSLWLNCNTFLPEKISCDLLPLLKSAVSDGLPAFLQGAELKTLTISAEFSGFTRKSGQTDGINS